jgi:hypothetical protein
LEEPYQKVYEALLSFKEGFRQTRKVRKSHPRTGVPRTVYERYLGSLGWEWVPTMKIGSGCKVHLRSEEVPGGRIIVRLSRHLAAVVDGTLHDLSDCSREGKRCVYGYYKKKG